MFIDVLTWQTVYKTDGKKKRTIGQFGIEAYLTHEGLNGG